MCKREVHVDLKSVKGCTTLYRNISNHLKSHIFANIKHSVGFSF